MKIFLFFVSIIGIMLMGFSQNIPSVGATTQTTMCTMDYTPVCGTVQVQCVTTPCNPIKQTFSNSCMARASNATSVTPGECGNVSSVIVWGDVDIHGCKASAGYTWSPVENKCIRPWENQKMTPRAALQDGTWLIDTFNNKTITASGSLKFSKNAFYAKLCNNMNGQYGTLAGALIFRKVATTLMYCDSDIMQVEDALRFSRAQFSVGNTTLTITTKKWDVIVWKKQ